MLVIHELLYLFFLPILILHFLCQFFLGQIKKHFVLNDINNIKNLENNIENDILNNKNEENINKNINNKTTCLNIFFRNT